MVEHWTESIQYCWKESMVLESQMNYIVNQISLKCLFNYLGEDGIKAYPKATFIIARVKFAWKQDFNEKEYCTKNTSLDLILRYLQWR